MSATAMIYEAKLYSGDCENSLTPARRAFFERKAASRRARLERISRESQELALQAMGGVLPADSDSHVDARHGATWVGGILFTDGSVHLFDRGEMEHYDYAYSLGKSIQAGGMYGSDGWGFYVDGTDGDWIGTGYMVPEDYCARLNSVVGALLNW